MSNQLAIRVVQASELDLLRQISISTFIDTYGDYNTPENMSLYLANHFSDQVLARELSNPEIIYLLAEIDEEVVGYLKLNEGVSQTENTQSDSLEIERIYVIQQWKGQGIGAKLIANCKELARSKGLKSVWLGVWEKNQKAIQFYLKTGFWSSQDISSCLVMTNRLI